MSTLQSMCMTIIRYLSLMCSEKLSVKAKTTTLKINFPLLPTPQILIHSIHQNYQNIRISPQNQTTSTEV